MARRLAREEGMLCGGSTGTLVHVAVQVAREMDDPDAAVVALLCDTGERYLSKAHSDEWMRENRMLDLDTVSVRALIDRKTGTLPPLVHVRQDVSIRKALDLMQRHAITQIPVLEEGESVGSVGERGLMGRVLQDMKLMEAPVSQVMEPPFPVVHVRDSFEHVTTLLGRGNDAVLVRDAGAFVAILTRADVLDLLRG